MLPRLPLCILNTFFQFFSVFYFLFLPLLYISRFFQPSLADKNPVWRSHENICHRIWDGTENKIPNLNRGFPPFSRHLPFGFPAERFGYGDQLTIDQLGPMCRIFHRTSAAQIQLSRWVNRDSVTGIFTIKCCTGRPKSPCEPLKLWPIYLRVNLTKNY